MVCLVIKLNNIRIIIFSYKANKYMIGFIFFYLANHILAQYIYLENHYNLLYTGVFRLGTPNQLLTLALDTTNEVIHN